VLLLPKLRLFKISNSQKSQKQLKFKKIWSISKYSFQKLTKLQNAKIRYKYRIQQCHLTSSDLEFLL
jgi:hypothetical protein